MNNNGKYSIFLFFKSIDSNLPYNWEKERERLKFNKFRFLFSFLWLVVNIEKTVNFGLCGNV